MRFFACIFSIIFPLGLPVAIDAHRPGDVDLTFGVAGISRIENARLEDIVVDDEGRVIVVGSISNTDADFITARLNRDGSLDSTFGADGIAITDVSDVSNVPPGHRQDFAYGVEIQPDGKILVAGSAPYRNGQGSYIIGFALVRYLPNGTLDPSFGNGGKVISNLFHGATNTISAHAFDLAIQADGTALVVGWAGSSPAFVIARYLIDGTIDTTFGSLGITRIDIDYVDEGASVIICPDGKILAGGALGLVRLLSNGDVDTAFGQNGVAYVPIMRSIALRSDGRIIVGGPGFDFHTYSSSGVLQRTCYGGSVVGTSRNIKVVTGDKVIQFGTIQTSGNNNFGIVRRRLVDCGFDSNFGNGGLASINLGFSDHIRSGIVAPSNQIYLAGVADTGGFGAVVGLHGGEIGPFDFDGEGKTDVSVFRPDAGEWWYLRSSDGGNRAYQFGAGTDAIAPADFTGDGKTDVAFWRPSTGEWYILRSEDGTFYSFPFGADGDVAAPADYDGDGKADAAVFRPSSSTWFVNRSSDGQTSIIAFGTSGDKPVPADYDGDGKADVAIYRPNGASGGEWWYLRSSDGANRAFAFGASGDQTVPADYTGDGKADIAFFRPSIGAWFILRSEDSSFYSFPWGTTGDLPTPGDYDGDGKADAAVFRPSNSTWYAFRSTGGPLTTQFGTAGDRPAPNAYVR